MRQSTGTRLDFAMFDFVKVNTGRQSFDDGLNDFRMPFNRDKTALSIAGTRTRVLPGFGQTNFTGS